MATKFIRVPMSDGAPEDYPISGAADIDLLSAAANFDGSGAIVDFQPAIQVLDESGQIVATALGSVVAAGDSAEVTFAPFLRPPFGTTPSGSNITVVGTPDTVVDPTELLFSSPFTVTNVGGIVARIELAGQASYTPLLTSNATDPTIGAGGTTSGRFVRHGPLVYANGVVVIGGAGFDPGTGVWQVTLPVLANGPGNLKGTAHITTNFITTYFPLYPMVNTNGTQGQLTFQYTDALPFGTWDEFPGPAGWTFAAGDRLEWNVIYEAA